MPRLIPAFLLSAVMSLTVFGQELDQATVKNLVDSARFIFVAQTMVPAGATSRTLTYPYDVRLSKDSLITDLPYAGRAYSGIQPGESGVSFTSTDFQYKSAYKKKKWEVSIKPKDSKLVKELSFIIFDNGHATLSLYPLNKQSITYYGYLKSR